MIAFVLPNMKENNTWRKTFYDSLSVELRKLEGNDFMIERNDGYPEFNDFSHLQKYEKVFFGFIRHSALKHKLPNQKYVGWIHGVELDFYRRVFENPELFYLFKQYRKSFDKLDLGIISNEGYSFLIGLKNKYVIKGFPIPDLSKYERKKDKNTIIWAGRFETTKLPLFAISVLQEMFLKGYNVKMITLNISDDYLKLATSNGIEVLTGLSKEEYYNELAKSEYGLITTEVETSSVVFLEMAKLGVKVIAPAITPFSYWTTNNVYIQNNLKSVMNTLEKAEKVEVNTSPKRIAKELLNIMRTI